MAWATRNIRPRWHRQYQPYAIKFMQAEACTVSSAHRCPRSPCMSHRCRQGQETRIGRSLRLAPPAFRGLSLLPRCSLSSSLWPKYFLQWKHVPELQGAFPQSLACLFYARKPLNFTATIVLATDFEKKAGRTLLHLILSPCVCVSFTRDMALVYACTRAHSPPPLPALTYLRFFSCRGRVIPVT